MNCPLRVRVFASLTLAALSVFFAAQLASAQQYDQKLYSEMRWRCIGPFRGGRTVAITAFRISPTCFYMAAVNGGVWKTTDFGNTWKPIFDDQPTGSVGALAVAPSDPNIHLCRQRRRLAAPRSRRRRWHLQIHRRRENLDAPRPARRPANYRHPRRSKRSRSRFRGRRRPSLRPQRRARRFSLHSMAAKTFEKVLYKDENTGAADLAFDPSNPQNLYAVTVGRARRALGSSQRRILCDPGSGLFKSTDGGNTWRPLAKVCPLPPTTRLASASPSSPAIPSACISPSEAKRRSPASTAPTMPANPGNS